MIQIHKYDSLLVYDENKMYNVSFLDEGQLLYEEGKFDETRKYYSLIGDSAKWAKFFIGAAFYMSAQEKMHDINDGLRMLEKSSNRQDRGIVTDIYEDLHLFKKEIDDAETAFRHYIESGHTQYVMKVKEMLYER